MMSTQVAPSYARVGTTERQQEEAYSTPEAMEQGFVMPTVLPLAQPREVTVGDINFHDVTMDEAVCHIQWMATQNDRPRHVCTGNLDHLYISQKDEEFRQAYAAADLVLADGMPVVWLSRGGNREALRERVTGSDLFWELGKASARTGLRLFFLGGKEGSADAAAVALCKRYPGAQICGTYCPPFHAFGTPAEEARIASLIKCARPHILLVGLGAPKQEKWIMKHKDDSTVPVSIGVGGTFEMACGEKRRAPIFMQRIGLEWVYRMFQDPARLGPRYLFHDLPFMLRLMAQRNSDSQQHKKFEKDSVGE